MQKAYQHKANELADWAWEWMVNRTDVWGGYFTCSDGGIGPLTCPRVSLRGQEILTKDMLVRHFSAEGFADIIGLHSGANQQCKWIAVDIDAHTEDSDIKRLLAAGLRWREDLKALGYNPLLTGSNGKGGMHLRLIFDKPVNIEDAHFAAKWLTRNSVDLLGHQVETFPKQKRLANPGESGQYGNWLRLPGRHHKRDYWSSARTDSGWAFGEQAVEAILASKGESPEAILDVSRQWRRSIEKKPNPYAVKCKNQRKYGLAVLQRKSNEVSAAKEGTRTKTLFSSCLRVGNVIGAGHLDREEAELILTDSARSCGLTDIEIRNVLRTAIPWGIENSRTRWDT